MAPYEMGTHTHKVPMSLFKGNRTKLITELKKLNRLDNKAIVLLQGGDNISLYDTDVDYVFRQESFFNYLFGVTEPGCYGTVELQTGKSTLFVPRLPEEYAVWMGKLQTCDEFKKKYEVDEVYYVDELDKIIEAKQPSVILTLSGVNSDSGLTAKPAHFKGIENRVIKSPEEIEVLRYVAKVSSDAHKKVMQTIRPGLYEYHAEAEFLAYSYYVGGCRHMSYTCICGAGNNSSILHYGHAAAPNDRQIKDGEMCLFDMGANYCGYAADITCSFPANGKFTEDQKLVYNAVLAARNAVLNTAKEGESWVDMHLLANRVMLGELKKGGLLKGEVDNMIFAGLDAVFQPHGLGHLIGLDVHDVGGYLEHCPPRPTKPGVKCLRFARILKAGMYVTVEPGCYFIDCLLDKALADPTQSKYLVPEVIARFRGFGGVRIEDDVLITKNGVENFAVVPRTVEEIEALMAQRITPVAQV